MLQDLPANAGDIRDVSLIPGSGRSPGGGSGNPLQYSCLGNPTDGLQSLAGYSPWVCKESGLNDWAHTHSDKVCWNHTWFVILLVEVPILLSKTLRARYIFEFRFLLDFNKVVRVCIIYYNTPQQDPGWHLGIKHTEISAGKNLEYTWSVTQT